TFLGGAGRVRDLLQHIGLHHYRQQYGATAPVRADSQRVEHRVESADYPEWLSLGLDGRWYQHVRHRPELPYRIRAQLELHAAKQFAARHVRDDRIRRNEGDATGSAVHTQFRCSWNEGIALPTWI